MNKPTNDKIEKAEEDAYKAVKATLLISGAEKHRYGKLKDELIINYQLDTNQYPDTYKKAMRILGNYQVSKSSMPFRASPNGTGVVFIQLGGQGGREQGGQGRGQVEGKHLLAWVPTQVETEAEATQVP